MPPPAIIIDIHCPDPHNCHKPEDEDEFIVWVYANISTPLHYDYPRFIQGTTESQEDGYMNPVTVFIYWSPILYGNTSGSCTMLPGLTYPTLLSGYLDATANSLTNYQFPPGRYHLCMLEPARPEMVKHTHIEVRTYDQPPSQRNSSKTRTLPFC